MTVREIRAEMHSIKSYLSRLNIDYGNGNTCYNPKRALISLVSTCNDIGHLKEAFNAYIVYLEYNEML